MKPERVRAVGRARGKNSRERLPRIAARINLQDFAIAPVKPGDDEQFVAGGDAFESRCGPRLKFKPRGRRAFGALLGRFAPLFDR